VGPLAVLAERFAGRHAGVVFVADDLAAWLIGVFADAGRKKLTTLVLGDEQERALRPAATEAVQLTAAELCPADADRAGELAIMIGPLFKTPVPGTPLGDQATVLEALQVTIAGQVKVLDDRGLAATVTSLTGTGEVPATVVAQKLTANLLREIMARGSRGGPLEPLANQLGHDRTYLQGLQIDGKLLEILALVGGTRAAEPVALAQLPAAAAGFTGRDSELAVLAGLLDPAVAGMVASVAGLAGVGKTTLAVQAGHAARGRGWFGGGVLFIDLHGYDEAPVEPGQALDALLRALRVPAEDIPPTVEERAGLYRSVLAQISEPVLVIADNASAEAQVRPLLPGAGPHKVLVTSRNTLAGLRARLIDVMVLDQAAATDLLDEALRAARPDDDRITGDRQAAARLAGVCGGLPLALQITAALLNTDPTLSTAELAEELATEESRLERLAYDVGSGTATPSVAAAFQLSYRRLDKTSARVFGLLPVNPGPDLSTAAAAVLADLPVPETRRVLAGLAAAHLAEAAAGAAGRWRMHDLVRLYAQQLPGEHADADGREQARGRLLGYYLDMAGAAHAHLRALPGTAVPDMFTGRDDALAWLDAERPSLVAAVQMAAGTGRDQAALRLPLLLAEYLSWRRRFDDWLAVTTISLETARRLGERRGEAAALNNLGNALAEVRRFGEAITAHQDAAAIYRDTSDRHREGTALTNLGNALQQVRRFGEAITAHQDAATIYRDTSDRHREAMALTNLGLALQQVRRFDEAITACQDAAAIFRDAGDRHREAMAVEGLGQALHEAGRSREAITAFQDAIALYRQTGDRYREDITLKSLERARAAQQP
jgi:tetratricopeptide (TPR) repeat protein